MVTCGIFEDTYDHLVLFGNTNPNAAVSSRNIYTIPMCWRMRGKPGIHGAEYILQAMHPSY
jgi:hypothetical protein